MSQFQAPITRAWVSSFILCYSDEIIHTKSIAQEEQRLQVPQVFRERTVQNLKDHLQRCTTEVVFNLDEVTPFGLGRS
jgi:hypothetical protein